MPTGTRPWLSDSSQAFSAGIESSSIAMLEADQDEMRAVIGWSLETGHARAGLRVAAAIWRLWQHRGRLAEGRATLTALLAAPDAAGDSLERAAGLSALGGVMYWQGEVASAQPVYEEEVALCRRLGDSSAIANSLYDLSFPLAMGGEADAALALQRDAFERFRALGDERRATLVRESMAVAEFMAGNLATARSIEEQIVAEYRAAGRYYKFGDGMNLLMLICLRQGDLDATRRNLAGSAQVTLRTGDLSMRATALQFGSLLAIAEGRLDDAMQLAGAFAELQERSGPFLTPATALGIRDPLETLREQLTPSDFEAGLAAGRARPGDEVLAELANLD